MRFEPRSRRPTWCSRCVAKCSKTLKGFGTAAKRSFAVGCSLWLNARSRIVSNTTIRQPNVMFAASKPNARRKQLAQCYHSLLTPSRAAISKEELEGLERAFSTLPRRITGRHSQDQVLGAQRQRSCDTNWAHCRCRTDIVVAGAGVVGGRASKRRRFAMTACP